MHGTRRHPARSSGRPAFLLLSVLALLAMACFPGLAQAEESVHPVYEPEVPKVTGHTNPPKKDKSQAEASNNGGATVPGNSGTTGETDGSGSEDEGASVGGGNPGSGGDGGTGQGSPGNGSKGDAKQAGNGKPPASQEGRPARAETSSDDSSSPAIPILIAIAALAAISIGGLLYRQRRQRTGTSVSPKAS
jgi:cobalamin biosynthesis Mg chelatase CobN